jgi:hypothetical protein
MVLLQTFSSLHVKVDIDLWQSVGLGWDDITSTALTKLHSIRIKKFQCNCWRSIPFRTLPRCLEETLDILEDARVGINLVY